MRVRRRLLVIAGGLAATLTLTVGVATAAPTPTPPPSHPKAPIGGPVDPYTVEVVRKEGPLAQAAKQLRPLTDPLPGYAGVIANPDKGTLTIYWKGAVPNPSPMPSPPSTRSSGRQDMSSSPPALPTASLS